ncbi:hypothetical protein THMIRHAS_11870 [Thiosulfatimonas sediminis]|uniref:Outer membrane protein beta-barrel domain-containing protein n=1 Tax=Thiosulfatimonas sediminis TaxID=2675054 RepID=A0A6F8PUX6_9GAMM|nr:DUF6662 family protein [Thiosulfatimonas sediminis]BBP45814.1 hypothetical protein THMIRHAS_11870 [Thiosulfatimonas sediminis]
MLNHNYLPRKITCTSLTLALLMGLSPLANAGESLLGVTKGAEPLPKGAKELYQKFNCRADKGSGDYHALDFATEFEYGISHRFAASIALLGHHVKTSGLIIDGYIPEENQRTALSGIELGVQYAFLTPALDDIGLATSFNLEYDTVDKHSGQNKDTLSATLGLQLQKYFLDGQLVWLANAGLETTHATRQPIASLDPTVEWPTFAEMEIGLALASGLSYRYTTNWSVGFEGLYEEEYETEVGQERWSLFAGPSIHYGGKTFWSTLSYLTQVNGGGERYDGQPSNKHLIEKTHSELRLMLGYNF